MFSGNTDYGKGFNFEIGTSASFDAATKFFLCVVSLSWAGIFCFKYLVNGWYWSTARPNLTLSTLKPVKIVWKTVFLAWRQSHTYHFKKHTCHSQFLQIFFGFGFFFTKHQFIIKMRALGGLGGLAHLGEMIFIPRPYGIFYLSSIKRFVMSLEKDCLIK